MFHYCYHHFHFIIIIIPKIIHVFDLANGKQKEGGSCGGAGGGRGGDDVVVYFGVIQNALNRLKQ